MGKKATLRKRRNAGVSNEVVLYYLTVAYSKMFLSLLGDFPLGISFFNNFNQKRKE